VLGSLAETFWQLIVVPFQHAELIWGIVPVYFGWIVNEITSPKASFSTAIQTGFALLWSGAHWTWQATQAGAARFDTLNSKALFAVSSAVTLAVLIFGALALWSGLRRRYPQGLKFLGHTRFAGYFMIAIFPIQSGHLDWTWERVGAIALFATPVWIAVHLALLPLRR